MAIPLATIDVQADLAANVGQGSGLGTSTDISVTRSPLAGSAQCIGSPAGALTHVRERTESAWVLKTTYRGASQDVDLEKFKDLDTKQMDELWKEVKLYLPAGATEIKVDLGTLVIRYRDSTGAVTYKDVGKLDPSLTQDVKLMGLMTNVRSAAQRAWIDLRLAHNFNEAAHRAKGGLKPLQIPTDEWKKAMPKSLKQFTKDGHFDELVKVSNRSKEDVRRDLRAVDDFLEQLKEKVEEEKLKLSNRMSSPDFHSLPSAEYQAIKNEHNRLETLLSEIDDLDRLPLYFAVGVWGDSNPKEITSENRLEKARTIAEGVEMTLRRKLKPGEDNRWEIAKKLGIGEEEAVAVTSAGPFIYTYAGDAGDLVVPDKLDHIRRLDKDGREERAPALIEFVTQAMIHNRSGVIDKFDFGAAFDSLNLGLQGDVRTTLLDEMKKVLTNKGP